MMYQEVVIDMQNREVGLAPAECPEHRVRPAPPPRPPPLPRNTKHPTTPTDHNDVFGEQASGLYRMFKSGASLSEHHRSSGSPARAPSASSAGNLRGHRWCALLLDRGAAELLATALGAAVLTLAAMLGFRFCTRSLSMQQRLTDLKRQSE